MRVADVIVDFIAKSCSQKIFLLTGNGAMYINDAMQVHPEIEYVCVRNEALAPLAASAYSQLTGRVGTVCVTAGPGAANAIPGVIEAWVDRVSILVISGQVPVPEQNNYGRNFQNSQRSFGIAGIPIVDYVTQFTKLSLTLSSPKELQNTLLKILDAIHTGRPGPIWLDIPLDVQSMQVEEIDLDQILEDFKVNKEINKKMTFNFIENRKIKKALKNSKKILFVLGSGAKDSVQKHDLINWLEVHKSVYALTRPSAHLSSLKNIGNLGVLGVRGRPWSKNILESVDLIVGLGTRLPSSLVGSNYSYLSKDTKILLINDEPAEFVRHHGKLLNCKPSTISEFLLNEDFAEVIKKNGSMSSWLNECEIIKDKMTIQRDSKAGEPLDIYWFCEKIEEKLNADNVLTSDAGSNYYACGQSITFSNGFREVTSGTFAAMGVSIPLAIGSSIAIENKHRVVCITGDGSIELNVQELQTISNYNLNIAIFVINNGGYASMRTWQDTFFDSRYIGSTDETGTKPMNFSKIASTFGLEYLIIKDELDFETKIDYILNARNPILVEVMCDPAQVLELPLESDVV